MEKGVGQIDKEVEGASYEDKEVVGKGISEGVEDHVDKQKGDRKQVSIDFHEQIKTFEGGIVQEAPVDDVDGGLEGQSYLSKHLNVMFEAWVIASKESILHGSHEV